jgi:hypothetical protein
MSSHEARINDALKQLGEEFRLGMVQAEEYRSRRRLLLESWGEIDATTSPGSLRVKTATTPNRAKPGTAPAPAAATRSIVPVVVVAALVVLAIAGFLLLKPKAQPAGAGADVAPAEALSPQVLAVRKAADDFVAVNVWDAAAVEAFLQQWRALDAADRARADEQPALRTLRYKLDQNIQAESQLVAPDAPPEERQRLTLLEGFARELSGEVK